MKYMVEITETLSRVVVIDADDGDDAVDIVERAYSNEDIVLDAEDFKDVEISIFDE